MIRSGRSSVKADRSASRFPCRVFLSAAFLFACLMFAVPCPAGPIPGAPGFFVASTQIGPWPDMLGSFGLQEQTADVARIIVLPEHSNAAPDAVLGHVQAGRILILEGDSPVGQALGIRATAQHVSVNRV